MAPTSPALSPVDRASIDFGRFATATASFEVGKRRFILPEDIRRSAKWDQSVKEEQIVAEFVARGHIRLHKQQHIAPRILKEQESIRKTLEHEHEQEVALQISRDRYQDAYFVPSDKFRVELREETVLAFLGDQENPPTVIVFLQVGYTAIDVLTQAVRMKRLASSYPESS